MLRPRTTVLPDAAMVPEANLRPAPVRLSHVLPHEQPYHYAAAAADCPPDGQLAAGTQVLLLNEGTGVQCQVLTAQGLCVFTACAGLRALPS